MGQHRECCKADLLSLLPVGRVFYLQKMCAQLGSFVTFVKETPGPWKSFASTLQLVQHVLKQK